MTDSENTKAFPNTSPELAKLFGFGGGEVAHVPVADLPVADGFDEPVVRGGAEAEPLHPAHPVPLPHAPSKNLALRVASAVLPYLFIFVIGAGVYYFFLSGVDFSTYFQRGTEQQTVETPKDTALDELKNQGLSAYSAWIRGFYFDVSDEKILDPDTDASGNGLTNFQKYLLNLNPKAYDTLSLGSADSETLARGLNPNTGTPLSPAQKAVVDKYFDLEIITNRLTLSKLNQQKARVAGVQLRGEPVAGSADSAKFGSTGSVAQGPVNVQTPPPLNGQDVLLNTETPGRLEIPSLNINVPIIFSKDPKDFDKDLQVGVIHYPGTAIPGQIGTTYISGHSSNYVWAKGSYNRVFASLGNLADGASFKITVVGADGKDKRFYYVVNRRQEFQATDPAQFDNGGKSTVALSTCWPVGTTQKRLVIFGELTQIER